MRVLLTSRPLWSHLMPMVVPVARALQAAGHEVAVATGTTLAGELGRAGLRHLAMPRMLGASQMGTDPNYAYQIGLSVDGLPLPELVRMEPGAMFGRLFAGVTALRAAEDMAACDFQPDLVVRECTELGGYLLAERLGVPSVTLDITPLVQARHQGMLPWLNDSRAAAGLPSVQHPSAVVGAMWVSWLPESWYPQQLRSPAHAYYRSPGEPGEVLDPAIAGLPADRPFVLATLGSNTWVMPRENLPLRQIVEALGRVRCTAVVALGREYADPADWCGPRPDNVHLVSFAQQRLLLPSCDLFLTHAGFNAVRESLTAGVPMVALPMHAEQPANAQRLFELGVGLAVRPEKADAATLASACQWALDNPAVRRAARRFQRQILGLPGIDQLVADLTALTENHDRRQRSKRR
jgi:UDP:flavonoid glycosyltransferase YjiC (YdhE family)